MVLIKHLPRESPFKQAVDPAGNGWSAGEHLQALAIDEFRAAHGVDQRVRRPGDPDPDAEAKNTRERMMANRRKREAQRQEGR